MGSTGYIQLPVSGTPSWKSPVANEAALPASGNTLGDARVAEDTGVIYVWTGSSWTAPSGAGTVTSVALTAPGIFSVSGSPITGSGTLALSLATQSANLVWAGPGSGSAAAPTFRALVSADIPSLSYVTSVALTMPAIFSVAGSPVTSSGTLAATLATQSANLVWAGPGTGSAATPTFRALVAADIPSLSYVTSVALTVPSFLSVSGSPITSSGTLAISLSGTALPIANGGTGHTTAAAAYNALSPMTTTGDIEIESGASTAARLAIGTTGQVLTVVSGLPAWAAPSGSLSIGESITSGTANRFLYEASGPVLADSANFSFDSTNQHTIFGNNANAAGGASTSFGVNTLFGDSAFRYQGGGGGGISRSTAIGGQAGANFIAGVTYSTFVGSYAGGNAPNTSGANTSYSTAIGAIALGDMTTGFYNTAGGAQSLQQVTTGNNLTAYGTFSGQGNVSGVSSIYLGCQTTAATSSESNTLVVGDPSGQIYNAFFGLGSKPYSGTLKAFQMQTTPASGSNASAAASTFTHAGAGGTGTGVGGDLIFSVALPGSSGSTLNTQTQAMRIKATLAFPVINVNGIPSYASDTAAGVGGLVTGDLFINTGAVALFNLLAVKT